MTTDDIFRIQSMIHFLNRQKIIQKEKDYSYLFVSVLDVLCSRYISGYGLFVPQENIEEHSTWITKQWGGLSNAIRKLKSLFDTQIDYRPLLVLEMVELERFFSQNTNLLETRLMALLGWDAEDVAKLELVLAKIPEYQDFSTFKKNEERYFSLPKFNIAICATMSAGKSTFINALLGHDYLPSRNEATTATITTVQDKDHSKSFFGCIETEMGIEPFSQEVTLEQMNSWNDSPSVQRIYLQGDLDNIGNHNAIVCVHDTPGTNNSGDENHHDITMNFLKNNPMDALIFVANGEHLCTNDEKRLLEDLQKYFSTTKRIPVIFALNKMDSFDTEKESPENIVKQYKTFVKELGFNDELVFPVSAKAARLFKMALKGNEGRFTTKERVDFDSYFHMLAPNSLEVNESAFVQIRKKIYPISAIKSALNQSGIFALEERIEILVQDKGGCPSPSTSFQKETDTEFEIAVVATMSSGKSTLINAMLGKELLPARIEATTATITRIHDTESERFSCQYVDSSGQEQEIDPVTLDHMNNLNNLGIPDIHVYGKIHGIDTQDLRLVLTDTPGPNNSMDSDHREHTYRLIKDSKFNSMILFILNATQLETNDDNTLLREISEAMRTGGRQASDRFIFVMNKADEFDPEEGESVERMMKKAEEYLAKHGIGNPRLFPCSAYYAKLLRQVAAGVKLTKRETLNLLGMVQLFIEDEEMHFSNKARVSDEVRKRLDQRLQQAIDKKDEYEQALIHTGIPAVEETINEYLEKYAALVQIKETIRAVVRTVSNTISNTIHVEPIGTRSRERILSERIISEREIFSGGNGMSRH